MSPTDVQSLTSQAGDFAVAHGLGRVPLAAVPIATDAVVVRLQSTLWDNVNVYLNGSDDGFGFQLFLW